MFLNKLLSLDDAIKTIRGSIPCLNSEYVNLDEAYLRVAAQNMTSLFHSPPFHRSAMDGYAIRAEDTFGHSEKNPTYLTIVDRIGAGQLSKKEVNDKEAVKIATGAPIPSGANAVIMEEYTKEEGNSLQVNMALFPGENISRAGEDFKKNDKVIDSGMLLRPQELAIIASAGFDKVSVYKKPRVAVIITGTELVMPNKGIEGAEVINSNHYTVKAMVESSQAVTDMFHAVDDENKVEELFKKLLNEYDAIITTGGTAISKGDVVVDVAHKLGEVLIHGVALRPGKPFAFARIQNKPVFMLSGFPVAAMVQFDVFVREGLYRMQGLHVKPLLLTKKSGRKIPSTLGRTDYVRAKIEGDMVNPLNIKGSGIIKSMVDSDSYIIIPENVEGIVEGEECQVLPYHSLKP